MWTVRAAKSRWRAGPLPSPHRPTPASTRAGVSARRTRWPPSDTSLRLLTRIRPGGGGRGRRAAGTRLRPGVTTAHPILEGFSDNVCVNATLQMAGYSLTQMRFSCAGPGAGVPGSSLTSSSPSNLKTTIVGVITGLHVRYRCRGTVRVCRPTDVSRIPLQPPSSPPPSPAPPSRHPAFPRAPPQQPHHHLLPPGRPTYPPPAPARAGVDVKVESDDEVEPYHGTYACLFCFKSVRGMPALA